MQLVPTETLAEEQTTVLEESNDSMGNLLISRNLLPVETEAESAKTCRSVRHHPFSFNSSFPWGNFLGLWAQVVKVTPLDFYS